MKEIKTLTVDEYFNLIERFFSDDSNKKDKVIKAVFSGGMTYLVRNGLRPDEDYIRDWYNTEPFLQHYFATFEDCLKAHSGPKVEAMVKGSAGRMIRCLFRENEVVYQPGDYIPSDNKERKDKVKEFRGWSDSDTFLGFRRDPLTFVSDLRRDSRGYIDSGTKESETRNYNLAPENYRVFYVELTPEEYLKEEQEYLNHPTSGSFNDGFIEWTRGKGRWEYSQDWKEFLMKNTKLFSDQ